MRSVLLVLVVLAAAGGEAPQPLRPASDVDDESAAVVHALIGLRRGETEALEALPAHVFARPLGLRPEPTAPERRWTEVLPTTLARTAPEDRARALAAIGRCFAASRAGARDPDELARIAARFLPAPAAVAAVRAAADRAFDLGRFRRYLAISEQLADAGAPPDAADRRPAVARELFAGNGPALVAPGAPEEAPELEPDADEVDGVTIGWRRAPGWLLAVDAWGGTRWQVPLPPRAEVCTGPGGAVIRDTDGLRVVAEDGATSPLPPAPPRARPLAVAGGAAWFAEGDRVYRLALAGGAVAVLRLPAPPLAAPVVRGEDSLWLTDRELVLTHGNAIAARMRHRLPADEGWTLAEQHGEPLIAAPGARRWRVPALDGQLAHAEPLAAARLLARAGRIADARRRLAGAELTDPAMRLFAERLAIAERGSAAVTWQVEDGEERAWVLFAQWRERPDVGNFAAIVGLGKRTQMLPGDLRAAADDPEEWDHAMSSATCFRVAFSTRAAIPATDPRRPVGDGLAGEDEADAPVANLAVVGGFLELTCRDRHGDLLWRRRWRRQEVPEHAVAVRGGWVVVVEGRSHVTVLDARLGDGLAAYDLVGAEALPDEIAVIGAPGAPRGIAMLAPPTVGDRLCFAGPADLVLPLHPAGRWLAGTPDGGLIVVDRDGGGRRYVLDGTSTPVDLPHELTSGAAPTAGPEGLRRGDRLFPWRLPPP